MSADPKISRKKSPEQVFDRLYSDAKQREKLKDPYSLVKEQKVQEHSMLFEDNDEIDYNPSNDEIKRVNLNKTKSERVYEDIIKEQMRRNTGKPEIGKLSRKMAEKQLSKFAKMHREQQEITEAKQGKMIPPPQGLVSNFAKQPPVRKARQNTSPQLFISLDSQTGQIQERKPIVERTRSRKATQIKEQPKIQTHREIHSSNIAMPLRPKAAQQKEGAQTDRAPTRKGTLVQQFSEESISSTVQRSFKKVKRKEGEDRKKPIQVDLPKFVSSASVKVKPAVSRKPPPPSNDKPHQLKMNQVEREQFTQSKKKTFEEQQKKQKEAEFAKTCTFKPKIERLALTPPPPDIREANSPRSEGYSKKSAQKSHIVTSSTQSPNQKVNTGSGSVRPSFNPKQFFDPKRLIDSIETEGFTMSSSLRVPPPNGLLFPENFKKRKVISKIFVKSRRQKPNYYESLTPSYKQIGFRTGCDLDNLKTKSKPVNAYEDSEIPGVKVVKGKNHH